MSTQQDLFASDELEIDWRETEAGRLALERPTLWVTNWSSRRLHGPGRKWSIMAKPRKWEKGEGAVSCLVPEKEWLDEALRWGTVTIQEYRSLFVEKATEHGLAKGKLQATVYDRQPYPVQVESGDTLCCACSRAAAARGECHRVWAAELLVDAGWRVVLDGRVMG